MTSRRIRDLVDVVPAETVVRLDGRGGRLRELVLTGDVARSLGAVLEAARGDTGAGFFVVGHFGSGKSHFLAALGELLESPASASELPGWDSRVRGSAERARPSVAVAVPLVEYRAGAALEEVVWRRAWQAAGAPAPPLSSDRVESWERVLAAAGRRRPGVVFLIDELSEFLRAKQGPALTEDLRFLQFLGEWARTRPALVVCALQESIEEVANVSQRELARIRDRYPLTLGLSMRHVEDLVRGRLVRLRPDATPAVEQAYRDLKAAFPRWRVARDRFFSCYPVHPETLELLGGLRVLLSQQRGVVDFICRQLRGDPAAGLEAWQERDHLELLTPDRVYDHFRARLHERLETSRLADTVVPYYERAIGSIFDAERDRSAALRVVKLLVLLRASTLERPRDARELAEMLLVRASVLDPEANYSYFETVLLDTLLRHGAYVVSLPGAGGTLAYGVELEAEASVVAGARVAQARTELQPDDRRPLEALFELGASPALPLGLLRRQGLARREVVWQNTLRSVLVTTAALADVGPADVADWLRAVHETGAEACLVVAEPEQREGTAAPEAAGASARLALWLPDGLRDAETEFLTDLFCRRQVLEEARAEGRTEPGGLVDYLSRTAESDTARAREILLRCYFEGRLVHQDPDLQVDLPALSGLPFDRLLKALSGAVLESLHPRHREVQPRGELVGVGILRQLLTGPIAAQRLTATVAERTDTRHLIESYLVPLGAMRKRGDAYVLTLDPGRSPAVAELLRLVPAGGGVPAAEVARRLREGALGLNEAETVLLLNAGVQCGVLQAHRGRRRLEDPFFSLAEIDRLTTGELVPAELRARTVELEPLLGPGPFEPWNVRVQETCWEHARAWLEARREELGQVRAGLERLGENPNLAEISSGQVRGDVAVVENLLAACDLGAGSREGLEKLLAAVTDAAVLLESQRRLSSLARFFRSGLSAMEAAAAYLTHPDLVIPAEAGYVRLAALRDEARELAGSMLALAAEDRAAEFFAAWQEFHQVFGAAYAGEHARYHGAEGAAVVAAIRASPEYRALAALAEAVPGGVPDDRVKVDRALAAAFPAPCRRPLDMELRWKPLCACGFRLGQAATPPLAEDVLGVARRGVAQHLAELARPEAGDRLRQAIEDLASLGRREQAEDLSRLLGMAAASGGEADTGGLAELAEALRPVLREVLGGGEVVARRDLARLREDLVDRRYTKRRLLELLAAWVDGGMPIAPASVVAVVDSAEPAAPAATGASPTVAILQERFPELLALLPAERPADSFWLAAWWATADPPGLAPGWLPAALLQQHDRLRAAVEAAVVEPGARGELADLDARVDEHSLLGDQLAEALGLGGRPSGEIASVLLGERLLRHPLRLAAAELLARLGGDWELAELLSPSDLDRVAEGHVLVKGAEPASLRLALEAGALLRQLDRRVGGLEPRELVEDAYPRWAAPVPALLSQAELALSGPSLLTPATLEGFRLAALRLLRSADAAFHAANLAGFPGCLPLWEVGREVIAPLLERHQRVAVLIVDAMRTDLWLRLRGPVLELLPGRRLTERWAVVPEPTRTAEAMAALYSGQPVPAGAAPGEPVAPFAHLGYESRVVRASEREPRWSEVRAAWAGGPRLTVVVAGGVDERLHRTPVELAAFLDEAATALSRRLLPTLQELPPAVPLVILADHGFRESASWGRGGESRYTHGGLSLAESVVPVAVFEVSGSGRT